MTDPSARPRRPHRPGRYSDLTELIDAQSRAEHTVPGEVAASTAAALLDAGRDADPAELARLVRLGDDLGLETLTALWREAPEGSLAACLLALYLVRHWCRTAPDEVSRLWLAGQAAAGADVVVAGVGMHGDRGEIVNFGDALVTGVFGADLGVTLRRGASFLRVVALGRGLVGGTADDELAARNERAAATLDRGARRCERGQLD